MDPNLLWKTYELYRLDNQINNEAFKTTIKIHIFGTVNFYIEIWKSKALPSPSKL